MTKTTCKMLLLCLVVSSGCSRDKPPYTIYIDEVGHFAFTDQAGQLYGDFRTITAARANMNYFMRLHIEGYRDGSVHVPTKYEERYGY